MVKRLNPNGNHFRGGNSNSGGNSGGGSGNGGIGEAPKNNKQYARRNATWKEVEIPEIPPAGIEEANSDDKLYGRKNKEWTEIEIPNAGPTNTDQLPEGQTNKYFIEAPTGDKQYVRSQGNWVEITLPNTDSGIDHADAITHAKGAADLLSQQLLAEAAQPALTVLCVAATTTGKVQGVSLGYNNVVEVYESGATYVKRETKYREFMSLGEPICFTGLKAGAIITSTQGFYGGSEQASVQGQSPMPLLSMGLAFTETFLYADRDSHHVPPHLGGPSNVGKNNRTGQIIICNGSILSTVSVVKRFLKDKLVNKVDENGVPVLDADGNNVQETIQELVDEVVLGQQPRELDPFELTYFYTDGNSEYLIKATSPVMGGFQCRMGTHPPAKPGDPTDENELFAPKFQDARVIMPITADGITWASQVGFVSAPFINTTVNWYARNMTKGEFSLSPGNPADLDEETSSLENYLPNMALRLKVRGLISVSLTRDGNGVDGTPMQPVNTLSQVIAQPFFIANNVREKFFIGGGNLNADQRVAIETPGDFSGIAITSPYKGTAKVYAWNEAKKKAELKFTVPLNRGMDGTHAEGYVVEPETQLSPAAGIVSNDKLYKAPDGKIYINPIVVRDSIEGGIHYVPDKFQFKNNNTYILFDDSTGTRRNDRSYTYVPESELAELNFTRINSDTGIVPLNGDLAPGYIIADVPIAVVCQNGNLEHKPILRSQAQSTTEQIQTESDEMLCLGWTPEDVKARIITDSKGLKRKEVVSDAGIPTYPLS